MGSNEHTQSHPHPFYLIVTSPAGTAGVRRHAHTDSHTLTHRNTCTQSNTCTHEGGYLKDSLTCPNLQSYGLQSNGERAKERERQRERECHSSSNHVHINHTNAFNTHVYTFIYTHIHAYTYAHTHTHTHTRAYTHLRSEERRVGKECISRLSPYH